MKIFTLGLVSLLSAYAAGAASGLSAWMRGTDSSLPRAQDTSYCETLFHAPESDLASVWVAPDRERYAVLSCSSASQIVEIRYFDNSQSVAIYSNNIAMENYFAPLGVLWTPDGSRVFIKYGYQDIGNGFWFPHNAVTGDMIGDQNFFERLKTTSIEQRTDPLTHDGPEPVWALDGREFDNEYAARSAGYSAFFSSRAQTGKPESSANISWENGKKYSVVIDPKDRHWLAELYEDERMVDAIETVAPMYQHVIFAYERGSLVAKLLPREGGAREPSTVIFGMKKLERVTDLGNVGLLVQTQGEGVRYWQILDPKGTQRGRR